MSTIAKFHVASLKTIPCSESVRQPDGSYKTEPYTVYRVEMRPVYSSDPASQNAKFFKATPSGSVLLDTRHEKIARQYPVNSEQYVLFENMEKDAPTKADNEFRFRVRKLCNDQDDGADKLYGVLLRAEDGRLGYPSEIDVGTINNGAAQMFLGFGYVKVTIKDTMPHVI